MTTEIFFERLHACINKYDLLRHPFYQTWSAGKLTREDLQDYAKEYYHHVHAFPAYLADLATRLDEGELRQAVLANMGDENGDTADVPGERGRAHSELWLDFAEGVGGSRDMSGHEPLEEVKALVALFRRLMREGTLEEALAALYAYESQVPRVAQEKARWLRARYGADERTCEYFTLHTTADVVHSQVWRQQLENRLKANPESEEAALQAGETAAQALWRVLDRIELRPNG